MKRSSFSCKMRQSLSDITNSHSQEELNNLQEIGSDPNEHLNRIMKENVALVKLLEERDKTIELNRYKIRNLREGIHKLQAQNCSLAQTNSQFLAVINLARNKVKALQHEITCKNALLKTKCFEQEKYENTEPRNALPTENVLTSTDDESPKPFVPNRRRFIRSKSIGASTVHKNEAEKEKSETKRKQLRKKSSRMRRSTSQETTENLFEIKDLQLDMPNDICQQGNSKIALHARNKDEEDEDLRRRNVLTTHQDYKVARSPFVQSVRKTPERIHYYK